MILSKIENVKPEPQPNNEPQPNITTSSPAIGNTNVIGGFVWKRTGSFLDQIKDVWELRLNNKVVATVTVNTINYCTIEIFKETHKAIHGIESAKKYVLSIMNEKLCPNDLNGIHCFAVGWIMGIGKVRKCLSCDKIDESYKR